MIDRQIASKRVVLVFWKNKTQDPFEVFSNLKNFCLSYKKYNYNTLNNYLSKARIAYDNEEVRVERKSVLLRPKKEEPAVREIALVVRKTRLTEADDAVRDLAYWLAQPPSERIKAVTFLVSQTIPKGSRMDKTKIVKRKLHV